MIKKLILRRKSGFTLIELIVTIAVLGILVLIAAPRILGYTEKAQLTRIQHDVKIMEQEMELVNLDKEVNIASWDDNKKDLGMLILKDELYEKEGFARSIEKSHLDKYYESQILGTGGDLYSLDEISQEASDISVSLGYKIIPSNYRTKINSKLKGTFYANPDGKVYYEHDKPLTTQKEENMPVACDAPSAESLGYTFEIINGKGTITKYDHREENIIIPSEFKVIVNGEETCEPVRIIGKAAFAYGELKEIHEVPAKEIIIPESVEKIEDYAFSGNAIGTIKIPGSVKHFGSEVFQGNSVGLPKITVIGEKGKLDIVGANYQYGTPKELGLTFDYQKGEIISYNGSSSSISKHIVVPKYVSQGGVNYPVKGIAKGAYQGKGLVTAILPEGLERIEDYAFSGNRLTGITIPNSVVHIGNYAFSFNEKSVQGRLRGTMKTVVMKEKEQFPKIDKFGDILENKGGPKVDLFAGELRLLDHIFVTSIGNHVVDEKYVGGEQKESEEGSETSPNGQDGPIVFNGLGPEAFDGDENTRVNIDSSTQTLKWEGDLSNREIVVSGALNGIRGNASLKFTFFNGNNIVRSPSFPNIDSITYSKNGSRLPFTFSAIVPKGADSFKIEGAGSNQSNIINEIYSPSELRHVQPQTVNVDASDLDITLSWEFPQRVIIIKNDVKLEEGIMNSYTDKPLHPNTQHNYKVLFIDEYGNGSNNFVTVSEFTKDREIVFSGLDPEAWDRDISTGVNIDSSTRTLKWEGNLNGRILRVDGGLRTTRGSASLSFTFYNGENVVRSPSFPNSDSASYSKNGSSRGIVFTAVVPDEADRLVIKGAGSNQTIMIDEVSVVD